MIRGIVDEWITYGHRRIAALLNHALEDEVKPMVNHKRVYRIMKMNNLLLQKHTGKAIR